KKFLELLPDSPERRLLVRMVATQRFSLESFTQEAIQCYLRALFKNINYRENVGFAKAVPRQNASRSWNQQLTQRGVTLLQASSLRAQLSRMEFLVVLRKNYVCSYISCRCSSRTSAVV